MHDAQYTSACTHVHACRCPCHHDRAEYKVNSEGLHSILDCKQTRYSAASRKNLKDYTFDTLQSTGTMIVDRCVCAQLHA